MNIKKTAFICFICMMILGINSSILTAKLFYGMGGNEFFGFSMMLGGLCLDVGKYVFLAISGYSYSEGKWGKCILFTLMASALIGISLLASIAFDLNVDSTIVKKTISDDGNIKIQSKLFDTTTATVEELTKEIKKLDNSKPKAITDSIKDLEAQRKNAVKLDRITHPTLGANAFSEKIRKQKIKTAAEIDKKISDAKRLKLKKESEQTDISKTFGNLTSNVITSEGTRNLAKFFDKKDVYGMVGKISMIKNITFEVAGLAFACAYGYCIGLMLLGVENMSERQDNGDDDNTPTPTPTKRKRKGMFDVLGNIKDKITPKTPKVADEPMNTKDTEIIDELDKRRKNKDGINPENVKRYLKEMYSNRKGKDGKQSPGVTAMYKLLEETRQRGEDELSSEDVRKIKGHLETLKIVKTVSEGAGRKYTIILQEVSAV